MTRVKRYLAQPLVYVGALNWGIIGMFNFDFIKAIIGGGRFLRVVDMFIGAAALLIVVSMAEKEG